MNNSKTRLENAVTSEPLSGYGCSPDEQTPLEDKFFRFQLELAKELELPVMVHTPHRDKKRGTSRSMDVCEEHGIDPSMVVMDHNNEETVAEVLQRGFWAGFSIYLLPLRWAMLGWLRS